MLKTTSAKLDILFRQSLYEIERPGKRSGSIIVVLKYFLSFVIFWVAFIFGVIFIFEEFLIFRSSKIKNVLSSRKSLHLKRVVKFCQVSIEALGSSLDIL